MARLVKRTATGPYRIEVGGETKVICGCGLSRNQPFCDSTHKTTARTEDATKLYWYDAEGNRQECADVYPGIRTP
jgi:CDGSH iron-sulfur domain-containing protein 3